MPRRLLLVSTSTTHGTGYLDHCAEEMRDLLGDSVERVLFVPYALHDREGYAATARERFHRMGYEVDSVHDTADPRRAAEEAQAVFIGGGNTFRLLKQLREAGLIETVRARVESGMPYMSTSAGSNVACVSIGTTNDMPIVEVGSLAALNLVPFNLNPHYLDPLAGSTHMGETRETRINEFLEENDNLVVGLREGAMLRIEGNRAWLRGTRGARIFRRGRPPQEIEPGSPVDWLLGR